MTREEAIEEIEEQISLYDWQMEGVNKIVRLKEWEEYERTIEAFKMAIKALEDKRCIIKKLEEMYKKYERKLWENHEDVCGNSMIETEYAGEILRELLSEFGCWMED